MDYILVLLFVIVCSLLFVGYIKEKRNKWSLVILGIIVIFFCGCRQIIPNIKNSDAYVYKKFYESAYSYSWTEYLALHGNSEIGFYSIFYLFARMNLPYVCVRIVYYITMLFFSKKIVDNINSSFEHFYEFFFLFTNFVLSHCLMRNCISYVVGWGAITYYYKGKDKKAIFYALMGTTLHNSCIIVLAYLIFSIGLKKCRKYYRTMLYIFVFYGVLVFAFPIILSKLGESNGKIAYYLHGSVGSIAIATNGIRIMILLMLLLLFNPQNTYRIYREYRELIVLICFSLSIIILQLAIGIAYRFLPFFDIINLLAFQFMHNNIHDRNIIIGSARIYKYIILLICFFSLFNFLRASLTGYGLIPIVW